MVFRLKEIKAMKYKYIVLNFSFESKIRSKIIRTNCLRNLCITHKNNLIKNIKDINIRKCFQTKIMFKVNYSN